MKWIKKLFKKETELDRELKEVIQMRESAIKELERLNKQLKDSLKEK